MSERYDLKFVKGKSFFGGSTADVLREVADFAEEMEGYQILSVNLGYSADDYQATADVMYEG